MSRCAVLLLAVLTAAAAAPRRGTAQQDDVRVEASLSETVVRAAETFTLEVSVSSHGGAPDDIAPPPLPQGLQVIGTQDFSEYQFSLPGGRTRSVRRQFQVLASAPGRYAIPPVAVTIDGVRYHTNALLLTVRPAAAASRGGERVGSTGPGDEVVLNAWLTPDTVWVGQQVTMRAEALFSEDVRMRLGSVPQYQAPTPSGFWTYDLGGGAGVELRYVHGHLYEVQTFRRAYFPLSAGRFEIPPAQLSYDVRRGFLGSPQTQELKSNPLAVTVRALPDAGRPADFDGAVGEYSVRAWIQPDRVSAGEAATLTVEVQGDGNVKALPPPTLPALADVQVYPPTEEAEEDTSGAAVSGVKRFSWVIVPTREGPLTIPSVRYPYFDPAHARYDVARSGAVGLRVEHGAAVAAAAGPLQIAGPARRPAGDPLSWVRSPLFAMLQATPLLAFAGVLLVRRRRRPRRPSRAELRGGRMRALAALRERDDDGDPEVLHALEELLRARLAAFLGDAGITSRSRQALLPALEEAGLSPELAAGAATLVARIDEARYRPEPPGADERAALIDQVEHLLEEIEGGSPRRLRTRAGAGLVAALLPTAALALGGLRVASPGPPPAAAAAPAPDAAFGRGIERYDAGAYRASAAEFGAWVRRHPRDAAAWYDLGNAWYRQGRRGRAVWAWLRALELAPRSQDARRNLAVAGVDPAVVSAALPAVPLSQRELLLLASLGWLVGGCALAAFVLRGRRALLGGGAAALVLAAAALAVLGLARIRPDTRVVLEGAPLRVAPDIRSERRGALGAGAAVRAVESRDGWVRVRAGAGVEGWMESPALGSL